MITDVRNTFAKQVSVAAAAGTAVIGDVIDTGAVHRDIGSGHNLFLIITIDTEIFTAGAAGTVKFQLVSDSNSNLITSPVVHFDSGTFATGAQGSNAALKAGQIPVQVRLPLEGPVYKEFLGIYCITATTTTTSGKINAFLTLDPRSILPYPEGVN